LPEVGTNQIAMFVAMTFVLGIVLVFLYAGLRPWFGAGVKTAIIAALIVGLMGDVSDVIIGLAPASLMAIVGIWSLAEVIVAAIAGAWVHKEGA
jgi:hypothetical protein